MSTKKFSDVCSFAQSTSRLQSWMRRRAEDYLLLFVWTFSIWLLVNNDISPLTKNACGFTSDLCWRSNVIQSFLFLKTLISQCSSQNIRTHIKSLSSKPLWKPVKVPPVGPSADDWLSDEEFIGMHILRRESVDSFSIFLHGQKTDTPIRFTPTSPQTLCRELKYLLQMPPLEPLQLDIGIFTFSGRRASEQDLASAHALAVYEGGAFMWPPVSIGHNHTVEDVVVEGKEVVLTTLAVKPALFRIHHVLARDEPEKFISLANGSLINSLVASSTSVLDETRSDGEHLSSYRTSSQAWLENGDDSRVNDFSLRTSKIMRVEQNHLEKLQVLRYRPSERYDSHHDAMDMRDVPNQPGKWRDEHYGYNARMATVFTYLTTVEHGGETAFPRAGGVLLPEGEEWLSECRDHFKVKAVKGTGVMWYNLNPRGEHDPYAIHMGCRPQSTSVKWSANLWIRPKPYFRSKLYPDHPVIERFNLLQPDLPSVEDPFLYESFLLVVQNSLNIDVVMSYTSDPMPHTYTIKAGENFEIGTNRDHEWQITANGKSRKFTMHKSLIDIGLLVEEDVVTNDDDEHEVPHRVILQIDDVFFPSTIDGLHEAPEGAKTDKSVYIPAGDDQDQTLKTEL